MREATDVESQIAMGPVWVGQSCTFHDLPSDRVRDASCPECGGLLREVSGYTWLDEVLAADGKHPGFAKMMVWSRGKCFPDQDTLENAYRQAMEGE